MLTALDGSFDSTTRTLRSYLRVLEPLPGPHRQQRIAAAQRHHAAVVLRLRKGAVQERRAQTPQLVAIEVVDELVEDLWRRGGVRTRAVPRERLQHPRVIAVLQRGRHRLDT